jgi:hypothetical protein
MPARRFTTPVNDALRSMRAAEFDSTPLGAVGERAPLPEREPPPPPAPEPFVIPPPDWSAEVEGQS